MRPNTSKFYDNIDGDWFIIHLKTFFSPFFQSYFAGVSKVRSASTFHMARGFGFRFQFLAT